MLFCIVYRDHRELHDRTHPFPTRRSSDRARGQALRFNDTLHTGLAAKSRGRNGAVTRWRQCVDLLAQFDRAEGTELSDAGRDALLSELAALRGQIDERQRMSTVIDLGSRLRSPALIKFFAADRPSICAAAMTRAQLGDEIGRAHV